MFLASIKPSPLHRYADLTSLPPRPLARKCQSAQNAADSESEDKKLAACLVKDSGYRNREPCPASEYAIRTAFGRFSASQYELRTGIISSLKPCTTSVG